MCEGLRLKLHVNVSSQMGFIIAADLKKKKRKKEKVAMKQTCYFNGNNLIIHPVNVPQQSHLRLVKLSLTSVFYSYVVTMILFQKVQNVPFPK